jgi:acyl-coenzyme A thioesterase 9
MKFHRNLIYTFKKSITKRIHTPGSLIFQHQKDLDNLQGDITKMNNPPNIKEISLDGDNDFEPGIRYFFKNLPFSMKVSTHENIKNGITPENGWVSLFIPADQKVTDHFKNLNTGRIRYGMLMELLDYLSAFTACRMNDIKPKSKQATIVTAAVDDIWFYNPLILEKPIMITSYPTWTGESSMEIRIDLYNDADAIKLLGSAYFVYALRDPNNYGNKLKTKKLDFELIKDLNEKRSAMLRYEIGKEKQIRRKESFSQSLTKRSPNQDEINILHNIFMNPGNKHLQTIKQTKREKMLLMYSQKININGHIFGGYIMREAIELGYVCAYMHSNMDKLTLIRVDRVTFHKPVIIGSVANFKAEVHYVFEELIYVSVEVYNYIEDKKDLTTTINLIYSSTNKANDVIPDLYEDGINYLEAKRRMESLFDSL